MSVTTFLETCQVQNPIPPMYNCMMALVTWKAKRSDRLHLVVPEVSMVIEVSSLQNSSAGLSQVFESFNCQHKTMDNRANPSIDAKIGTRRLAKPDETKGDIITSDRSDGLLSLLDEAICQKP